MQGGAAGAVAGAADRDGRASARNRGADQDRHASARNRGAGAVIADAARRDALDAHEAAAAADRQGRIPQPRTAGRLWTDTFGVIATRALQALLIIGAAALLVFALLQVTLVVIPLLLALIVASALAPIVNLLARHRWPRILATAAVLLAVLLVLGGAITLVVVQVQGQWDVLAQRTSEGVTQLLGWWNSTFPQFAANSENLTHLWQTAQEWLASLNYGAAASGFASGLGVVGNLVAGVVLFVVILFFFLKDGPQIWAFLIRPLRAAQHRRAELMGARAVEVLGGYVRGTVIVALVDAVFIGLGLVVLQVPLAVPLAVIVFITAFIPVVGATLAGVVAALVTLVTNGFWPAVIVVIIVVVVNQLEGNLLSPLVLGKSLALHELVVLLALMIGTVLGGIIGTLLAVPLTAVAWALIKAWNETLPELDAEVAADSA